jgi:uncharacterized peroxidase-related enzyme
MALLPYVDPSDPDLEPHVEDLLAADAETFGRPSLFARMLAHNPEVLAACSECAERILTEGTIPAETKELAYVAVSTANDYEYCTASHSEHLLQEVGVDEGTVQAIVEGELDGFEPRRRAVVEFACQVAADPKRVSEGDLQRLRDAEFDDEDVVELLVACSAAVAADAIADSLNVLQQDREDPFHDPTER